MIPVPGQVGAFILADHLVRNRSVFYRQNDETALCAVDALFDSFGYVVRFSEPVADAALFIADDRKRRKRKAAAALYDFCRAVEHDELFDEFFFFIASALAAVSTPASPFPSAFTGVVS